MPNWKKLVTSGSDASLASLVVTNAVSASAFSGSFFGDGSGLTGLSAGIFAKTGSSQNTTNNLEITGSLTTTGVATVGTGTGTNQPLRVYSTDAGSYVSFLDDTTTDVGYVQVGAVGDELVLKSANATALTLDSSQNATFAGNVSADGFETQDTGANYSFGGLVGAYIGGVSSSPNRYIRYVAPGSTGGWRGSHRFYTGQNGSSTLALTIDYQQNATFAGDVTLSAGDLTVSGGILTIGGEGITSAYINSPENIYMNVDSNDNDAGSFFQWGANRTGSTGGEDWMRLSNGVLTLGSNSTSNNAQFYATKTYSNASGTDLGTYLNYDNDTARSGRFDGIRSLAENSHTTGTSTTLVSVMGIANATGAGGTTTSAMALRASIGANNATATITNAYGVYIDSFTATGTITNRWGIYQAGASENNYLAGDLRIGTTSATSHGQEVLRAYGSNTYPLNVHSTGTDSRINFTTNASGTTTSDGFEVGIENDTDTILWNRENGYMRFGTAATERLRIASDAYAIGIGTTDVESWDSTGEAVEFGGTAVFGYNQNLHLLSTAFYDGAWKYKASSLAPSRLSVSSDGFNFYTAASGTVNTALTWSEKMRLTNAGMLLVGDTANANMTVGLTLNQGGNDDEILALKSSDIAHGLTVNGETDTWMSIRKFSAAAGGARIRSFYEDVASTTAMAIESFGGTAESTKSSSGRSLMEMYVAEHNGANSISNITADGNVFGVRARVGGSDVTRFIVDEDGDTWQSGGATINGAVEVIGSGSTVLDIQGSLGQLFSVTDDLTGTLFSVNDISGIPILSVRDDDYVTIGTFNDEGLIVSGSEVYAGTLSSDNLTIGSGTNSYPLHVFTSSTGTAPAFAIRNTTTSSSGDSFMSFQRDNGTDGWSFGLDSTTNNLVLSNDGDSLAGGVVNIDTSGNLTLSSGDLTVTGTVRATGDVIAYYSSDERLKSNIKRIENPLQKVSKLGGYSYNWNDRQSTYPAGTEDVGILAQEVKEVLEEAVTEREDGYLAVKYEKIIPLLIESVNELRKELELIKTNCQCLKK